MVNVLTHSSHLSDKSILHQLNFQFQNLSKDKIDAFAVAALYDVPEQKGIFLFLDYEIDSGCSKINNFIELILQCILTSQAGCCHSAW